MKRLKISMTQFTDNTADGRSMTLKAVKSEVEAIVPCTRSQTKYIEDMSRDDDYCFITKVESTYFFLDEALTMAAIDGTLRQQFDADTATYLSNYVRKTLQDAFLLYKPRKPYSKNKKEEQQ